MASAGFQSGARNTYVYDVPDAWIVNGLLTNDGYEKVYAHLYGGPQWRLGNDDGSLFVVLEANCRALPADDPREAKAII